MKIPFQNGSPYRLEPGWYLRRTVFGTTHYVGPYRTKFGAWIHRIKRFDEVRRAYPTSRA